MTVNTEQLSAVGQQIITAREALGWSQTDLAKEAGFTDNTIRKVERGIKVSPGTLRKVLETVGIEPLAVAQKRAGFPADVELVRDLIGMYLVALPEDERPEVAYAITRFLMDRSRGASSERTNTGE